ncbi:MAG TPA: SAM-dependent methyltransferase [Vicinamibacterales bacterium]|nr:SAM-dependent methyltransferase [Vicinamibacterales bacterium]
MDLALYHHEFGYYARAGQRSGRAGDFFTSVDVGPVFGQLLAAQVAECRRLLGVDGVDLVEAGAGNGRLSADILRALARDHPDCYRDLRVHLVESSAAARAAQRDTLGDMADRLVAATSALPPTYEGILIANELLDAMPVHQIEMRDEGLREVYVTGSSGVDRQPPTRLSTAIGPPSTPRLAEYLDRVGVRLEPGWRAEINLNAVDWMREAARRLRRGFIVLIDYGHEARELYSASHSAGTLTTFRGHREGGGRSWLEDPGEQDITAHVDWTSVRAAAEDEGMQTIGFLDQTYFVLGLLPALTPPPAAGALKTLVMPGGLGSTMKVLILGKGVGTPPLMGTSFKVRAT